MGAGLSTEIRRIIEVPRAEREEDLKQVLEEIKLPKRLIFRNGDFGTNGGQSAAPLGPLTYMDETNLTSDPAPAAMLPEREGPPTIGLIGHIPELDWWCKCVRGGPRKRRTYSQDTSCLWDAPSATEGPNGGHRTNHKHWTKEEVTALLDGLEKYQGRRWSKIKKYYFPKSFRTAENLKDKWRNLRESYTGNAERRCYLLLPKELIERIKRLAINIP